MALAPDEVEIIDWLKRDYGLRTTTDTVRYLISHTFRTLKN
jgi:hypothetical protein